MQERRYLLHIGQMLEDNVGQSLIQEAFDRIDGERRQKALSIKSIRAQAAGIGAGLLIQKALADYLGNSPAEQMDILPAVQKVSSIEPEFTEQSKRLVLQCFTVEELLMRLSPTTIEPCYKYGKNGKPYLRDYPFHFNLSHSGEYVFCGVSEQEIGVDIQKAQGDNELRLAKRFFSVTEYRILEQCGDEEIRRQMFFRMWARKEAYGKLTGKGLAESVGKNLWTVGSGREELWADDASGEEPGNVVFKENGLLWEEYAIPAGYRIVVCKYAYNGG